VVGAACGSFRAMGARREDWLAIQERLLAGNRLAFLKLNRLITGILCQLRAYDFRDEWDDLRQEVLLSVVNNARAGRLRDPKAFVGYVRIITRNKFVDRLKSRLRHKEGETLSWDEETARAAALQMEAEGRDEGAREVWVAVRGLPEEARKLIEGIYREGKTYQEMSAETGIPLGTMKRRLREGLSLLRQRFEGGYGRG
jgi:RNA polymerase sigma-70 factor (ECF subfamily)